MKQIPMKNYAYFLLALLFVVTYSCENESIESSEEDSFIQTALRKGGSTTFDLSQQCSTEQSVNLYAGQDILVGEVSVEVVGEDYVITYTLTNEDYCMTETHLSVVGSPSDFPLTGGGNPKIGHFEFSESHDCVNSYSYTVPTINGAYIAAHAVVAVTDCEYDVASDAYAETLPNQVDVCVTEKGVSPSYFDIEIAEGNSLSGAYEAWCADQDASLDNGQCFTADVYSSYETLPDGQFENPQNFGAVNWLMNQGFIGMDAGNGLGAYTFGDIQIAIWYLVDDSVCQLCQFTGPYNDDRIDMLVNMALANNDFVPGCGDDIVILFVPTNGLQTVFITIPAPCDECGDETAWGDGCDFPGNSWATYFHYQAAN